MSTASIYGQVICSHPRTEWLSMTLDLDTIGEIINERRLDRNISQPALVRRLNDRGIKASQSRLSDIQNGHASFFQYWPEPTDRYAVLQEVGFNDDEIRRLNAKFKLGVDQMLPEARLQRVTADGPKVRYFGPVNAGLDFADAAEETIEYISVPDSISNRFDVDRVFSMTIVGDSMACEDIQKTIPEGSTVYFLEDSSPHSGEVVCVRLPERGLHVVKKFQPAAAGGYVILESYNHKHEPIIVNEDNPGEVLGVYLTHIPLGPRLR